MKKVIISFYCNIHSSSTGWLRQFDIVEDVVTKLATIKARVLCIDNVERILDYSIAEFEYIFKTNLGEIELPVFQALIVASGLQRTE